MKATVGAGTLLHLTWGAPVGSRQSPVSGEAKDTPLTGGADLEFISQLLPCGYRYPWEPGKQDKDHTP